MINSVLINRQNLQGGDLEIAKQNRSAITQSNDQPSQNFADFLKNALESTDNAQKTADKMAMDLSTGKTENIHETMLALSQAELGLNFVVQVRNKIIESYQEVMRMQV